MKSLLASILVFVCITPVLACDKRKVDMHIEHFEVNGSNLKIKANIKKLPEEKSESLPPNDNNRLRGYTFRIDENHNVTLTLRQGGDVITLFGVAVRDAADPKIPKCQIHVGHFEVRWQRVSQTLSSPL